MTEGLKLRTLHWEFAGSLEPPRVVSCRTEEAMGKDNMFGQVTVRFHTQQVGHICQFSVPVTSDLYVLTMR